MVTRILRYLDIQPGEQRNFGILFLQTLLLGFATSFFFVSATSHFVKYAGVQNLPLAYLISGVGGFALVSLYRKLQGSAGIVFSYTAGLVLYACLCTVLYVLYLTQKGSHTVELFLAYAGLVLIMPFTAIFMLGFSLISFQVFSFAQSKRLVAIVGTGETVAAIIAFVSVPFLMKLIGDSVHLLPVSALLVLTALLPVRQLVSENPQKFGTPIKVAGKKTTFNLSFFSHNQFFTAILLFTFFSVIAVYLADYGYLIAVRYFSVQTEIETATIVAVIFSVLKTGELLFSFLSRVIQQKYGMRTSLLLLPCLLLLFSVFAAFAYWFDADPLFMLFFLIINKFNERVIRKGITTPAMKVVYQVTEPSERAQLQTTIEGIFSQVATILAGGLLMLVSLSNRQSPGNVLGLLNLVSMIGIVVYAGWLLLSLQVFARYKKKINEFLFSRKPATGAHSSHAAPGQWPVNGEQPLLAGVEQIDPLNRAQVLATLVHYNPALSDYLYEQESEPGTFFKRLTRIYFSNENFFSRVAVIWYAAFLEPAAQLRLFRDVYHISNQEQRLLLVRMIGGNRTPVSESFYFISLVQEAVKEAVQVEAALYDIAELDKEALNNQLERILNKQKNIILELLKLIYPPDAIDVIQSVVNQQDSSEEHQQFAVELLANILKPGVKEYVLPVFESGGFANKRMRLSPLFVIAALPALDRLKDLAMMDVKLVDPAAKQLAIETHHALTADTRLLKAFSTSSWTNLKGYALHALGDGGEKEEEPVMKELRRHLERRVAEAYLCFYHRYCMNTKLPTDMLNQNRQLKFDMVSIGMMFALQQQGIKDEQADA